MTKSEKWISKFAYMHPTELIQGHIKLTASTQYILYSKDIPKTCPQTWAKRIHKNELRLQESRKAAKIWGARMYSWAERVHNKKTIQQDSGVNNTC